MKRMLYITIFLLSFMNTILAWAQVNDGYLSIVAQAPIDKVIIDDSIYVNTNKIRLSAGTHNLVVQNADRVSYQAMDFIKTITIRPDEVEKVEVHFNLLSEINTYPYGADVLINSDALGITPIYLRLDDYKNRTLQFRKSGYEDVYITIMDSTIENNYLFVPLRPKIINRSNNQNQFVNLEWQERGPHKYKTAIWISNGLGIVFGAGAAYYKKKADDAFEKAKIARRLGDIPAREHYLSKTRNNDRAAVIGFVGMQINVVALVFFLLKSR